MKYVLIFLVLLMVGCNDHYRKTEANKLYNSYIASMMPLKYCVDACMEDQINRFKTDDQSIGAHSINQVYTSMKSHCESLYEGMECVDHRGGDHANGSGCKYIGWEHSVCDPQHRIQLKNSMNSWRDK
jgi:hypothetical protein